MIGRFKAFSLCTLLNKYHEIIIYGLGNYAIEIYPYLISYNLKSKIKYFTQTSESEMQFMDDIPVVPFDKLECVHENSVILVAVSDLYAQEIGQKLSQCGYRNVIFLNEYIIDYHYDYTEKSFYQLDSFEDYCTNIADWYVESHKNIIDKNKLVAELLDRGTNRKTNKHLIVFLCGHLSARISKIVGALKRKGFSVIILSYWPNRNLWFLDEISEADIPIYPCKCIHELLYRALQFEPLVYYFEPRWGDCLWAEIMLKNKKYFGKIVLSLYDIVNDGFIIDQPVSKLECEQFALENADGVVWRWFSKSFLENKGFRFQGKSIQFLDCCNNNKEIMIQIDRDSSIIKLCEVCGVGNEYVEDRTYNTNYMDYARVSEILERIGNRDDCIFHFYAGKLNEQNVKICDSLKEKYRNFNYFVNVEHADLIERLMQYDFGCDFYTGGDFPSDDIIHGRYTGSIWKNSTRNIFFDYLSAGIPIISTAPQKLIEFLDDYKVVVKMDLKNLDMEYLKKMKERYKEKVIFARKELDINNQISRLIDFFEQL